MERHYKNKNREMNKGEKRQEKSRKSSRGRKKNCAFETPW